MVTHILVVGLMKEETNSKCHQEQKGMLLYLAQLAEDWMRLMFARWNVDREPLVPDKNTSCLIQHPQISLTDCRDCYKIKLIPEHARVNVKGRQFTKVELFT